METDHLSQLTSHLFVYLQLFQSWHLLNATLWVTYIKRPSLKPFHIHLGFVKDSKVYNSSRSIHKYFTFLMFIDTCSIPRWFRSMGFRIEWWSCKWLLAFISQVLWHIFPYLCKMGTMMPTLQLVLKTNGDNIYGNLSVVDIGNDTLWYCLSI